MIAVTAEAERQQGRADAVKQSTRDLRPQTDEGQCEKRGSQRILLQRSVVRILSREQTLGGVDGPTEVAGTLMEMQQ